MNGHRLNPDFLTNLVLPAEEHTPVEQPDDEPVVREKCALKSCEAKPTHQILVVAFPGEETFTFANLQTCIAHIPKTAEDVFPAAQLDSFRALYPHTKNFGIRALALQ